MTAQPGAPAVRRVTVAYVLVGGLFTLAASLIWATNTIFLMRVGGLDLLQVMLVNASFTVAQAIFEVPTGVIADTLGRRVSVLMSMAVLLASTVLYVVTPPLGWGMTGFVAASALLGLGFTFQSGAVDAWLVDALDAAGHTGPKEKVFATGQVASGAGMLIGSLAGGALGQFDLSWPYVARAVLLGLTFLAVVALVKDEGFTPRRLRWSTFGAETRRIARAGSEFGWKSPVIRPLLLVSAFGGLFYMYAFYAWQPYVLELLGRDAVWLLGVAQAGFSAAGIAGNTLVTRVMRVDELRRDPARVLTVLAIAEFGIAVLIAVVGLVAGAPGVIPAAAVIVLWLAWGLLFGVYGPVRMAYINAHIPSAQRATVLSLDAFFADGGGIVGQPALGWVSKRTTIALAWLIGSAGLAAASPLYAWSGRASRDE